MKIDEFIDLLKQLKLKEISLTSPDYETLFTRFIWGNQCSVCLLALSLKKNSYFSHRSTMYFNNHIDDPPETIYVNYEQSKKPKPESSLEQERIDTAFKRKSRASKYIFPYEGWKICMLNGKNTSNLGVEKKNHFGRGNNFSNKY